MCLCFYLIQNDDLCLQIQFEKGEEKGVAKTLLSVHRRIGIVCGGCSCPELPVLILELIESVCHLGKDVADFASELGAVIFKCPPLTC